MTTEDKIIPVIVAIRARPLSTKEIDEGSSKCLEFFVENGQVNINGKPFYFDHIFDPESRQDLVYEMCGEPLIEKLFQGYNCTIFAYGQTGSGKTYTMGTECDQRSSSDEMQGVIPRMVEMLFSKIACHGDDNETVVKCSMLEIYEERVLDLLSDKTEKPELFIREHPQEGIFVQNLSQVQVTDFNETLLQLEQGCLSRTKGETAMNAKSSRSHAIFTIFVKQSIKSECGTSFCQAKLHLVDLAGSERLKKTQAQGERKKEGIKINEGLLALGNVISALTDSTQQRSHIPYRDSKLTRLLQDSLGGNTYTVMITCVSPSDSNYDETLSSLRYAERAKKIKNKPTVNVDSSAKEITDLRKELQDLQRQLLEYQTGHKSIVVKTPTTELQMRSCETLALNNLSQEVEKLKNENFHLSYRLTQIIVEHATLVEKIAATECQRDKFKEKLSDLQEHLNLNMTQLESHFLNNNNPLDESLPAGGYLGVYIEKCKDVQRKLADLQNDEALLVEEASFEKEHEDDEEFDEEKFRSRHSAASKQLEHLLKQITDKEKLIKESAVNVEQLEQLKINHQREITDLKEKIDAVQKERQELENQLTTASKTSKISENRRKKMSELEKQLGDYRKKLQELQKFEKMKVQNDQSMTKMKDEVAALKQQRVQLVRQLRVDNQRFREWQTKTEKQMNQMRVKEKRREYEAQLAKRNFDQQLNVHRRKYEEAVAFSKRLQGQLQRQNTAKKEHFSEGQENDKLINEVKDFLEKEIEPLASTEEAKIYCDNLLKQRTNLNQQLKKCEKQYERMLKNPIEKPNGNTQPRYEDAEQMQIKIASLRKEIQLATNEIQELRRKISSVDVGQLEERRWNSIRSQIHAKCALKQLFSMIIASRSECLQAEHQFADLQSNLELLNEIVKERDRKIDEVERTLVEETRASENQLNKMNIEYNNKVSLLLRQIFKLASGQPLDDEIRQIMQLHSEENDKLHVLTEQLELKGLENEQLTKELSKAKVKGLTNNNFFRQISVKKRKSDDLEHGELQIEQTGNVKRSRSSRIIKQPIRFGTTVNPNNLAAIDSSTDRSSEMADDDAAKNTPDIAYIDDEDDSDYRDTPFHKRLVKMTSQTLIQTEKSKVVKEDGAPARKKSKSNSTVCNCKRGQCSNSLCGCVKKNGKCTDGCTCLVNVCRNRATQIVQKNDKPFKFGNASNDISPSSDSENKANDNLTYVKPPVINLLNETFIAPSSAYDDATFDGNAVDSSSVKTSTPADVFAKPRVRIPSGSTATANQQPIRSLKPLPPPPQISTPVLFRGLLAPTNNRLSPRQRLAPGSLFTPLKFGDGTSGSDLRKN